MVGTWLVMNMMGTVKAAERNGEVHLWELGASGRSSSDVMSACCNSVRVFG